MYDLIIVGAGPAGLTAAIYAIRSNLKVLVLEKNAYGGQIINTPCIDNYPGLPHTSGFDFATALYKQVKELGCDIVFEEVLQINKNLEVLTNKNTYHGKSIILATGTNSKKLGLINEHKFIGKGISYCATCDGAFYKDKIVVVVGGGNVALEDALYLSNIASKVYLIHRRDEFRGEGRLFDEIKMKDNIEILFNSTITELIGDEFLKEIVVNDLNHVAIDGLFVAIGQSPNTQFVKDIISLDSNGYIESDDGVHTNIKNIYVAGDNRVKDLRQLVTAVSDGAIAATEAIRETKTS